MGLSSNMAGIKIPEHESYSLWDGEKWVAPDRPFDPIPYSDGLRRREGSLLDELEFVRARIAELEE